MTLYDKVKKQINPFLSDDNENLFLGIDSNGIAFERGSGKFYQSLCMKYQMDIPDRQHRNKHGLIWTIILYTMVYLPCYHFWHPSQPV